MEYSPPTQTGPPISSFSSPPPGPMFMDSVLSTKRERGKMTPMYSGYGSMPFRHTQTAPPLYKNKTSRRFAQEPPRLVTFKEKNEDVLQQMLMDTTNVYDPTNRNVSFFEQCFRVERKIGEGSFGEVVRAVSLDDGKAYAIKIALNPYKAKADRELKLREVYKHEKLPKHNNLVEFIKAWEERGRLFIQTELCEESLFDYILRKHEISQSVIWTVFADIVMALDELHQRNLIHLDVKPENIFITKDTIFKLGDFGLIFDLVKDKTLTYDEGDSKYLAPEVLNHGPTKAADIFCLGITLLEVGTDLDLPSQGDAWHSIRNGNIPERFLKNLGSDLRSLIFSMLDANHLNRPSTSELLKQYSSKLLFRRIHQQMINTRIAIRTYMGTFYLYILAFLHCCFTPFITAKNAIVKKKNEISMHTSPYQKVVGHNEQKPQTTPDPPPRLVMPRQIQFDHDFSDDEYEYDHRKRKLPILFSENTDTAGSSSSDNRSTAPRFISNSPIYTDSPLGRKKNELDASGDWGKTENYQHNRLAFDDADLEDDFFSCLPITSLSAPNSLRSKPRVPLREKGLKSPIPKLDFSMLDDIDTSDDVTINRMRGGRRRVAQQRQMGTRRSPRLASYRELFERSGSALPNGH
ncbi:unnamed protein product, partial [Mesorhabditis belari]|uniref:non-specific serine/threonine protein kinase n=1 Tax=Mesorhabditis belari TaxID=2138241 RepID=A0AAF3FMC5_9BILA